MNVFNTEIKIRFPNKCTTCYYYKEMKQFVYGIQTCFRLFILFFSNYVSIYTILKGRYLDHIACPRLKKKLANRKLMFCHVTTAFVDSRGNGLFVLF